MGYPLPIVAIYTAFACAGVFIVATRLDVMSSGSQLLWMATLAFAVLGGIAGWHGSAVGSANEEETAPHARRGGELLAAAAAAGAVFYLGDRLPSSGDIWVAGVGMTAMVLGFLVGAAYRKSRRRGNPSSNGVL